MDHENTNDTLDKLGIGRQTEMGIFFFQEQICSLGRRRQKLEPAYGRDGYYKVFSLTRVPYPAHLSHF